MELKWKSGNGDYFLKINFESEAVEFKREYTGNIKKEVVAFANTQGGIIYIGVDDEGNAYPVDNVDSTLQRLTNTIRDSILPDITFFVGYEICEDKVIKIMVNEGSNKPYFLKDKGLCPSGVYVRQGASSVQASHENIRRMIKITDGDSFEMERALNQELTFKEAGDEFEGKGRGFEENNRISFGIKNKDGLYTNMGLLVSDQNPFTVKIAVFDGIEKLKFRDRREISGSIFKQLYETSDFLSLNNKLPARIIGLDRVERHDYPQEAVREGLINALVHRDYSFGGSIIVNIYDDRMEFVSIGGLVKGIEETDLLSGLSLPRNKNLAGILFRLHYIESYGIGLRKIMKLYEAYKTKPKIDVFPNVFVLTLPNLNYSYTLTDDGLDEKQREILKRIKVKKYVTSEDIQQMFNVKHSRAYEIIKDMKGKGLIKNAETKGKYVEY
jgi:ATP-dependent DNA helicase RecG